MLRKVNTNLAILVVLAITAVILVGVITLNRGEQRQATDDSSEYASSTRFVINVYETIDQNFWKDYSQGKLTDYFARGISQLTEQPKPNIADASDLREALIDAMSGMGDQARREFPARLADLVLRSLPPEGRSRLYTEKKQENLKNRVNNIDPKTDLYNIVGASSSASEEEIVDAARKKRKELEKQADSTTTKDEVAAVDYAKRVLSDENDRQRYNQTKAEPTVFIDRLSSDVVHLAIHRYNQRTPEEFAEAVRQVEMQPEPSSLIIDLRSNVGGTIDVLPYLLGPFIGPDRAAYQFFQQGEKDTFRTKTGWIDALVPYKKVVVLVDGKTQSTGELMASVLKKYNVGTVVGTTTRGWGTVERVMKIDNQYRPDRDYSVFLVHHLTVRSDGQPIQDRGVVPEVDITSDVWQQKLSNYIPHQPLIQATKKVWNMPPPGTEI